MHRVEIEPFFILHTRPYSNTSLIIDILTLNYGRMSAIARSARGPKSRYKGMLQAFSPLMGSWTGMRELKHLGHVERQGAIYPMEGRALVCGFYLNELLQRLLQQEDPHPEIYQLYNNTLAILVAQKDPRVALRCFEKNLLQSLGYGLPLQYDAQSHEAIDSAAFYRFIPDRGFFRCAVELANDFIFSGKTLLGLLCEQFDDDILQESKRLLSIALNRHLGGRPIKSREMLV